ncbi:hypothetical protein GCM10027321_06570 [Massilia terrae]
MAAGAEMSYDTALPVFLPYHMNLPDTDKPRFRPRPWDALVSPQDVELWIEEHNQAMQELISPKETGAGIRFSLAVGGAITMQTAADAVILDVEPDAEWVAPLIIAATGAEQPKGQIWILPADRLVQLILGLSSLVESTILVTGHNFGARARMAWR